jgi:N-acetylglucosaminyldiphosphoundecaprenol N-acetyl-beta-D-mannosaminyltransferase
MRKDKLLRESVTSSDLVLADGAPLVWLSRLRRMPLPERVAGIDLMLELFALADKRKFRVFLLGATKSVLERVVAFAAAKYPNMVVVGSQDGYFAESQDEHVANAVRDSNADMLFVAMSSPRKEIFMNRWNSRMGVPVCHGVGGSFDVVAGVTKRAPRWMQRLGLEWLYRVIQEPGRMWKRYLVTNTLFLGLAIRELMGIGRNELFSPTTRDSMDGAQ